MLCARLDVSDATTRIGVVDPSGAIVHEGKVASGLEEIAALLAAAGTPFQRVGLQAGALAEWIHEGLAELGLPVVCLETRHLHATLAARPVETDRDGARSTASPFIAQVVRTGWFKPVHVKTAQAQKLRALVMAAGA
jgi:transposase